jgi:hypothetical protein
MARDLGVEPRRFQLMGGVSALFNNRSHLLIALSCHFVLLVLGFDFARGFEV